MGGGGGGGGGREYSGVVKGGDSKGTVRNGSVCIYFRFGTNRRFMCGFQAQ